MRPSVTITAIACAVMLVLSCLVSHAEEPPPPAAISIGSGCVSSQCHDSFSKEEAIHPKDRECTACHKAEPGMAHPGSGKKFRLAERDGCSGCHEEDKGQRYLHPAIAAGSCAACHNPHRGRAVKYLRDEEKKLCAACHESIASPAMQFLHKPIIDEGCRGCHGLHGSQYERLLRKQYPGNNTVGYNDKQYELCFSSCHNRNLLQFPDTSFSTKFRNGKRNLHYLHVNQKERGVNCKLCHAIHGGNKPALIAERVAFGRWQMPINFEQQGNTGSCQPGCHKHETYRHAD